MSFSTEEEFYEIIAKWFEEKKLTVTKKFRIGGGMELDIVAVGNNDIFKQTENKDRIVYVVEGKLAYTKKLIREVIEEAILRLAVADYVLIATPYEARIWVNEREQSRIVVSNEIFKRLNGTYSGRLGLMAVEKTNVRVIKEPMRSRLYVPCAKELIIKDVLKKETSLLQYKSKK